MVMAWDTAHILFIVSAASAVAVVAIVVATAVAPARAVMVAFILGGALPGASGFNFAFNTS